MVEKCAARSSQFDAVHATDQELGANLVFESADLPAKGRLRRAEPLRGSQRQTALLGDSDKIAQMPQLHGELHTCKACPQPTKSFTFAPCSGYLPGECWGRDMSIKVVGNFSNSIPDMTFDIKEVLVAGDRVVVRGEVRGTPAGELFGVPHSGKSFRVTAIDIQTIKDGKIAKTYHMENWLSALGQLRAK
jgi:ketosteroid isomerase-like protein